MCGKVNHVAKTWKRKNELKKLVTSERHRIKLLECGDCVKHGKRDGGTREKRQITGPQQRGLAKQTKNGG